MNYTNTSGAAPALLSTTESIAKQLIDETKYLEEQENALVTQLNQVRANLLRIRGALEGMAKGHQEAADLYGAELQQGGR